MNKLLQWLSNALGHVWLVAGSVGEVILSLGIIATVLSLVVNIVRDGRARQRARRMDLVEDYSSALLGVAMHRGVGGSVEDLDRLSVELVFRSEMLIAVDSVRSSTEFERYVRGVAELVRFGESRADPGELVATVTPVLLRWATSPKSKVGFPNPDDALLLRK